MIYSASLTVRACSPRLRKGVAAGVGDGTNG